MHSNSNNFNCDISDEMNQENCELTSAIKLTKHSLNEGLISKAFENFNEKLKIQNAVLLFQLASKFNLSNVNITVLRFIERCFRMIVDTESFLELDFNTISKILASSSLQIDLEVEVYNAANKWLSYNSEERSKFAKQLLLKVRLNLLSESCLKFLLNESSLISKNDDCVEVFKNRNIFYQGKSAIYNKSRQSNKHMFNILVFGGYYKGGGKKYFKQVKELYPNNYEKIKDHSLMLEERHYSKAVCFKGEVYVFGGIGLERKRLKSVLKYLQASKTWNYVCDLPDERQHFGTCTFLDNIYLFSGYKNKSGHFKSCLKFDAKLSKFKKFTKMTKARSYTSCAIYEGNIVVSGGRNDTQFALTTVESYDVFADNWTTMPSMTNWRRNHGLFCINSKLFAIGGENFHACSCEVFDKTSNLFVILKSPNFLS